MKRFGLGILFIFIFCGAYAQNFEVVREEESYSGMVGETISAPVYLTNRTNSPITLSIRPVGKQQIGTTQRQFLCMDAACKSRFDDLLIRLEPGETAHRVNIGLESGLAAIFSTVRYTVYNVSNPQESQEFEVNFTVEERSQTNNVYSSRHIAIRQVYPNPVIDYAFIDYTILNEGITAKIAIHNILGNVLKEYELTSMETTLKIPTDEFSPGIYFYTLYVDNESVMTRKIIVRK